MTEFADCNYCGRYMNHGASCSPTLLYEGLIYKRIPWKERYLCHDCNVVYGQYHHLGCDMERCPICGSQLIGCECFDHEEEE